MHGVEPHVRLEPELRAQQLAVKRHVVCHQHHRLVTGAQLVDKRRNVCLRFEVTWLLATAGYRQTMQLEALVRQIVLGVHHTKGVPIFGVVERLEVEAHHVVGVEDALLVSAATPFSPRHKLRHRAADSAEEGVIRHLLLGLRHHGAGLDASVTGRELRATFHIHVEVTRLILGIGLIQLGELLRVQGASAFQDACHRGERKFPGLGIEQLAAQISQLGIHINVQRELTFQQLDCTRADALVHAGQQPALRTFHIAAQEQLTGRTIHTTCFQVGGGQACDRNDLIEELRRTDLAKMQAVHGGCKRLGLKQAVAGVGWHRRGDHRLCAVKAVLRQLTEYQRVGFDAGRAVVDHSVDGDLAVFDLPDDLQRAFEVAGLIQIHLRLGFRHNLQFGHARGTVALGHSHLRHAALGLGGSELRQTAFDAGASLRQHGRVGQVALRDQLRHLRGSRLVVLGEDVVQCAVHIQPGRLVAAFVAASEQAEQRGVAERLDTLVQNVRCLGLLGVPRPTYNRSFFGGYCSWLCFRAASQRSLRCQRRGARGDCNGRGSELVCLRLLGTNSID